MAQPNHPMPVERRCTLYLGDTELVTLQATPVALADWAVGFLFTEGFIATPADVAALRCADTVVRVDLATSQQPDRELSRRYLTSGCGKGVTFSSIKDALLLQPLQDDLSVSRQQLVGWLREMQRHTPLYDASGGMHAAAAVHVPSGELLVREDIGRHNAVDKAIGAALRRGWTPGSCIVLSTGRISYEMCSKFARFGAGLGASLTASTDQAYRLALRLGLDLVGYLRTSGSMVVYTAGRRLRRQGQASGD